MALVGSGNGGGGGVVNGGSDGDDGGGAGGGGDTGNEDTTTTTCTTTAQESVQNHITTGQPPQKYKSPLESLPDELFMQIISCWNPPFTPASECLSYHPYLSITSCTTNTFCDHRFYSSSTS